MNYVLQAAVLMLMVSVGMSLEPRRLVENWRQLSPSIWLRLFVATFLLPPAVALALGHFLHSDPAFVMGLFLVAVVPGAPLMTRGAAAKGFDLHIAASYQVWGAVLTPVVVPLVIAACAALYGREIWVSPFRLLEVITRQQFVPFALGMLLMWRWPTVSLRAQRYLNLAGNTALFTVIVIVLYRMAPALASVGIKGLVAPPLLAVSCMLAVLVPLGMRDARARTLAICNANRHVGLAILLAGQQIHDERPVPAIAAYAISALVVMWLYAKVARVSTN